MQLSKPPALQASRVVAFIDIGTNSIRLFVVRIKPDCSYSVMSSQKEVVRLGEGEFEKNQIGPDAMNRAIMVAGRFVELARSFGAEEFVAVATSATREAKNRHMFLSRLRLESHLDVQVISGREEARLIYLGVTSALHIEDHHVMIIDIGGGSTEIAIGGQKVYSFLSSLKLGSIRLTNLFFPERYEKPVTKEQYETIRSYIREQLKPVLGEIKRHPADMFIGSSGTIINLCDIASGLFHPEEGKRTILNATELKKTVSYLCSLSLPERRKVQGINPDRADIIVAGAAIIDTLVQEIGIKSLEVTQRGLQDGLLADYLSRMDGYPLLGNLSVRERSVLQTGRSFGINEFHARTVSKLALDLFDSAKKEQLHDLEGLERELLEYAAFLHDIGSLISFQNHHEHSYYIIRNSNLLGFNSREINIMANIARFHR
ncbi:MAG: Ppx/GppA phosphatase family protein, partial [Methanomicrobiales archaeon]